MVYCLWISLLLLLYCPSLSSSSSYFFFFFLVQRAELRYIRGSRLISVSLLSLLSFVLSMRLLNNNR